MNEAYIQGFIQKCAEADVDPEELLKVAARGDQLYKVMQKLPAASGVRDIPKKELLSKIQKGVPGNDQEIQGLADLLRIIRFNPSLFGIQ